MTAEETDGPNICETLTSNCNCSETYTTYRAEKVCLVLMWIRWWLTEMAAYAGDKC